jgi:uncharacterized protein YbjT (DUF2867 family)
MKSNTTLVLGATGKTGRRVIERLEARNVPVRVGSRSAPLPFDWEDTSTWAKALQGVDALYISYFPDLAAPGAAAAIQLLTGMAVKAGVRRMVLISGRGEPEAQRCEEIVRACPVEWTLVRASWFAQNFSESYFLDPILAGEVELPAGDVGEPFVDADDIADVAVAALTEPGHAGQLYEVTGPRLLTFAEAVAEIGRACGREIRYRQIPIATYADRMAQMQVPQPVISLVTYLFGEVLDGRNASTTDGVMRALKRAPRDFRDYARDTAATGVWKAG